ncbi:hypothetical protein N9T38_00770 [SAR116 cluster bacterium]|nr:hypothetical protein [SAR116 cluster bacterium]
MTDFNLADLEKQRDSILKSGQTLIIAAQDSGGFPQMGVTPTIRMNGHFYIYPSRLSAHVRAMLAAGEAQFLIIEDEGNAQNIWARKRIKFDSDIIEIKRKSDEFNEASKAFSKAHGPTMDLIRDFTDFHLLKLLPREGVMVLGFAKAFALSGLNLQITKHLSES